MKRKHSIIRESAFWGFVSSSIIFFTFLILGGEPAYAVNILVIALLYLFLTSAELRIKEYSDTLNSCAERRRKLEEAVSWMEANVPEMECRGDGDCDHCLGLQILENIKTQGSGVLTLQHLDSVREKLMGADTFVYPEIKLPEDFNILYPTKPEGEE